MSPVDRKHVPSPAARHRVLEQIADVICSVRFPHPVRVGIDGIDGAGKTSLADELVRPVVARGRAVIRASIDRFHRPRAERYRRGRTSALGYYLDSFDTLALLNDLLIPLGPHGVREYRTGRFDYRTDMPDPTPARTAAPTDILLFDGVFLFGPELLPYWDLRIFVTVDPEVALDRAAARDPESRKDPLGFRDRYRSRYLEGNRLYLESVRPRERADLVVVNDDLERPMLLGRAGLAPFSPAPLDPTSATP